MKIEVLTQELIPVVTEGGNEALVQQMRDELKKAKNYGSTVYIRHEKNWLQWMHVDDEILATDRAFVEERILDDQWWERNS